MAIVPRGDQRRRWLTCVPITTVDGRDGMLVYGERVLESRNGERSPGFPRPWPERGRPGKFVMVEGRRER